MISPVRLNRRYWLQLSLLLGLPSCIGGRAKVSETAGADRSKSAEIAVTSASSHGSFDGDQGSAKPAMAYVSFDRRFQVLEGFGASVAWYLDRITGETPQGLYELLFPELGLDILRLRNRYQRSEKNDSNLAEEQEIVERATQALGHPPRIMMSSWSPPSAIKANGKERCRGNRDCTLKRLNGAFAYGEFADYWQSSLDRYAELGIIPEFISIQNEPDFAPPDWEGCRFDPTESAEYPGYAQALFAVATKLQARPTPPKLLGAETIGIHYRKPQNYLAALESKLLFGLAHHLYEAGADQVWDWRDPGPDSFVDEMRAVAECTKLPLFQTEFQTDDDRGSEGGFETAWLIHHSLVEEEVVAFLYWDLIWGGMRGLVAMNGKSPKVRDQYYSLRHYARFTDPGYQRIAADSDRQGVLVSAYIAPDEKQLTVVVLNTTGKPVDLGIDPGGFPARDAQAFRTTFRPPQSQRWAELGAIVPGSSVRMPARSVITFVFRQ